MLYRLNTEENPFCPHLYDLNGTKEREIERKKRTYHEIFMMRNYTRFFGINRPGNVGPNEGSGVLFYDRLHRCHISREPSSSITIILSLDKYRLSFSLINSSSMRNLVYI